MLTWIRELSFDFQAENQNDTCRDYRCIMRLRSDGMTYYQMARRSPEVDEELVKFTFNFFLEDAPVPPATSEEEFVAECERQRKRLNGVMVG